MHCKYRLKVKIKKEDAEIFYNIFLPDAKLEGWRIKKNNELVTIEFTPLNSEAQLRGIINSIFRQLDTLSRTISEL